MSAKPKQSSEPRRVVIYMPRDLSQRLRKACLSEGLTVSSWVRLQAEKKVGGGS